MNIDICGDITSGLGPNCDFPQIGGATDRIVIINFSDIDVVTRDGVNNEIITDITLKSGKSGYAWFGQNRSVEPREALVKGRYSNAFDHEVRHKIFNDGAAVRKQLNASVNGRFVAIVEANFKGETGDAAFKVFGIESGLEVPELEKIYDNSDTEGAFDLLLRSSEFAREPKLAATFFDTDYATTQAKVDALVDIPQILNIAPLTGNTAGSDSYTITGANFTGATQIDWVEGVTVTNEPTFVVDNDAQISISSSVALSAGTYKIRVTSPNGVGESLSLVVIS